MINNLCPTRDKLFMGFCEPKANFYRLPNSWHNDLEPLINYYNRHCVAPLKVLEYLIKHTWGYADFYTPVSLTVNEIQKGRRGRHGKRVDLGTGLSINAIKRALAGLVELGYIKNINDGTSLSYLVNISDNSAEYENEIDSENFLGFSNPEQNYIKIPANWSNICSKISSAATILLTEYFFRHCWGYHNSEGVWLTANELITGRKKGRGTERYDLGVGLDYATIYRALADSIKHGLIVWTRNGPGKERLYNLRLSTMTVSEEGEYSGPLPWDEAMDEPEEEIISGDTSIANSINDDVDRKVDTHSRKVDTVSRKVDSVSRIVDSVSRIVDTHSRKVDTVSRIVASDSACIKDTTHGKTHGNTQLKTPARLAVELPQNIKNHLVRWDWHGSYSIVEDSFVQNPQGLKKLVELVENSSAQNRAGLFRSLLREGQHVKLESPRNEDRTRFFGGEFADFVNH